MRSLRPMVQKSVRSQGSMLECLAKPPSLRTTPGGPARPIVLLTGRIAAPEVHAIVERHVGIKLCQIVVEEA